MFRIILKTRLVCLALLIALAGGAVHAQNQQVKNIILVHGAWADGSGWKGVYDILVKDGYNVTIVQEPETSFQQDVAATKRAITLQNGSCILVAHSLWRSRNHTSRYGFIGRRSGLHCGPHA